MAAELKRELGVEAQLIEGRGGIFEVRADGKVIYSKDQTDRFPRPGEVTALLKSVKVS